MRWVVERVKLNWKAALHFKSSLMIQIVGMMVNDLFWAFAILLLFYGVNGFGGLTPKEYLMAFGFMLVSLGLTSTIFGGFKSGYSVIVEGKLERYLTKPVSPLLQIAFDRVSPDALGDLLLGIVILLFTGAPLKLYLLIPFSFMIYTAFWIYSISAYFFVEDSTTALRNAIFFGVTSFAHWPSYVFPRWLKPLPYVILPGAMTSFYPVEIALKGASVIPLAIISISHLLLALFMWRAGLKRYRPRSWFNFLE